jgi:hypothetical protein
MEVFELYGGEVFLEYEPVRHTYRVCIRGRRYKVPSVTTICGVINKPALLPWAVNSTLDLVREAIQPDVAYPSILLEEIYAQAKKEATRKKTDAADRGTLVHEILAGGDSSNNGLRDESVQNRVDRARQWLETNLLDWLDVERPIYSRRYRYSGRLDGVCTLRNLGRCLLDYKTGKGLYPEFCLQTAGYVEAYEEEFPDRRIEHRVVLHVGEEACTPYVFDRTTLRKDLAAFHGAQKLWSRLQVIEKELKGLKKEVIGV